MKPQIMVMMALWCLASSCGVTRNNSGALRPDTGDAQASPSSAPPAAATGSRSDADSERQARIAELSARWRHGRELAALQQLGHIIRGEPQQVVERLLGQPLEITNSVHGGEAWLYVRPKPGERPYVFWFVEFNGDGEVVGVIGNEAL